MRKYLKQLGQGMTEYIIIVALIAIAAIAVYTLFGDIVREQVGGMAAELAGGEGKEIASDAATREGEATTAAGAATLDSFADK
jgi:type IV pilus assembly protein PilA